MTRAPRFAYRGRRREGITHDWLGRAMFLTLFYVVCTIFLMMAPGYVARRRAWMGDEGSLALSRIMVYAIYPCLIFTAITGNYGLDDLLRSWVLPAASAAIMVTGHLVGRLAVLMLRFETDDRRRAFLFQTTMNNYSFFPLAIVVQLYDESAVAALLFSTLGAEAVMWTLGTLTLRGGRVGRESLGHLASPPLVALYAAVGVLVLLHVTGVDRSVFTSGSGPLPYVHDTMKRLGACTVPFAMIIAGARMATLRASDVNTRHVWALSGLRLLLIPMAAWAVLQFLPLTPGQRNIMTVVAVMPVSLASLMLSELFGGDKRLMSGSVLLTHLLAVVTVPLLLSLLL